MGKSEVPERNGYGVKQWPPCERPREKMLRYGVQSLSNAELIALIIRSGIQGESALSLANRILALGDGITSLRAMGPEDYCRINGVGTATAAALSAAVEIGKRIAAAPKENRIAIDEPGQIAGLFMEQMRTLNRETFKAVLLNTKNEILAIEDISIGNLNSSIATPREVFHNAVKKSASSVIVAHNHPSGNPEPSAADIRLTQRLLKAGEILGIRVLDHIIVGDGIYVSLREENII